MGEEVAPAEEEGADDAITDDDAADDDAADDDAAADDAAADDEEPPAVPDALDEAPTLEDAIEELGAAADEEAVKELDVWVLLEKPIPLLDAGLAEDAVASWELEVSMEWLPPMLVEVSKEEDALWPLDAALEPGVRLLLLDSHHEDEEPETPANPGRHRLSMHVWPAGHAFPSVHEVRHTSPSQPYPVPQSALLVHTNSMPPTPTGQPVQRSTRASTGRRKEMGG